VAAGGYAFMFVVYVLLAVVAGGFGGYAIARKVPKTGEKSAVAAAVALLAVARAIMLVTASEFGSVSSNVVDIAAIVPYVAMFFMLTRLFDRVRAASSPDAAGASKLHGIFKMYYGFYALGFVALCAAAATSGSTHDRIAGGALRLLAASSALVSLFFAFNSVLSKPVGMKPDVALFRVYLVAALAQFLSSIVWVAMPSQSAAFAGFFPFDLVFAAAIAFYYTRRADVAAVSSKQVQSPTVADPPAAAVTTA